MATCDHECMKSRLKMCRNEQNTVLNIKLGLLNLLINHKTSTSRETANELFGLFDAMPILNHQVETRERCPGCKFPRCGKLSRYEKVLRLLDTRESLPRDLVTEISRELHSATHPTPP